MPETRPRIITLAETPCTCIRAVHTTCGGVQFQAFAADGRQQVQLEPAALDTFLATVPLEVLNRAVKARLQAGDNLFFALDDLPALSTPSPFYMALDEHERCHFCRRGEAGHWRDVDGRIRCWDTPIAMEHTNGHHAE